MSHGRAQRTLEQTSRQVGSLVWLDRQLFEIVGSWTQQAQDASLAAYFAATSHHFAWHASLLTDRLPRVGQFARDVVCEPSPIHLRCVEDSRLATTATECLRHLVSQTFVEVQYLVGDLLAGSRSWTDGALMHSLRVVSDDIARDWASGAQLLVPRYVEDA